MNKFVGKIFLLTLVCGFLAALPSCLDNNSSSISKTTDISRFYIYSDSVKNLEKYTFSIDREKFYITNVDSLDYGTPLTRIYPIIKPTFYSVRINDEFPVSQTDTFYLNFTEPVRITVVAADRKTEATYTVKVNVHQVDPDTFIWTPMVDRIIDAQPIAQSVCHVGNRFLHFADVEGSLVISKSDNGGDWTHITPSGLDLSLSFDVNSMAYSKNIVYLLSENGLYSSADGETWSAVAASGLTVDRLLFCLDDRLYSVAGDGSQQYIARLDNDKWVDVTSLPQPFPVKGAAVTVAESYAGKERAFVIGGVDESGKMLSSVWSTESGDYWIDLAAGNTSLAPIANSAAVQYNDKLYLVGGEYETGEPVIGVINSTDFGINWVANDSSALLLPQDYGCRSNVSVISLHEGYIYLIGGKTADGEVKTDVLRGLDYSALPGFQK